MLKREVERNVGDALQIAIARRVSIVNMHLRKVPPNVNVQEALRLLTGLARILPNVRTDRTEHHARNDNAEYDGGTV